MHSARHGADKPGRKLTIKIRPLSNKKGVTEKNTMSSRSIYEQVCPPSLLQPSDSEDDEVERLLGRIPICVPSDEQRMDFVTGVRGSEVPLCCETVTWPSGHETVLPCQLDTDGHNVLAMDYQFVKDMARFPMATETHSKLVQFVNSSSMTYGELLTCVRGLLARGIVVVLPDFQPHHPRVDLTRTGIKEFFGFSMNQHVTMHGESF